MSSFLFEQILYNNLPQFLDDTWHKSEMNKLTDLDQWETMQAITDLSSYSDSVLNDERSHGFAFKPLQRMVGCCYPVILANKQPTNWSNRINWDHINHQKTVTSKRKKLHDMCKHIMIDYQNIHESAQTFYELLNSSWNDVGKMKSIVNNMMPKGYPEALITEAIRDVESMMNKQKKRMLENDKERNIKMASLTEEMTPQDLELFWQYIQELKKRTDSEKVAKQTKVETKFDTAEFENIEDTWSIAASFYDKQGSPVTNSEAADSITEDIKNVLNLAPWYKTRHNFWYFVEVKDDQFDYNPSPELYERLQALRVFKLAVRTASDVRCYDFGALEKEVKSDNLFRGTTHIKKEMIFKRLFIEYFIKEWKKNITEHGKKGLVLDPISPYVTLDTLKDHYAICLYSDGWLAEYVGTMASLVRIKTADDKPKVEIAPTFQPPDGTKEHESLTLRLRHMEHIGSSFGLNTHTSSVPLNAKNVKIMQDKLKGKKKKGDPDSEEEDLTSSMMDSDND